MKRSSFSRLAATLLLSGSLLLQPAHAGDKTIVISQTIDLSGPNGAMGRDYVAGIATCFDAINAQGGLNGKRIKYVVQDDHGDPQLAAKLAGEVAERSDYVLGGIGDDNTQAVLNNPTFRQSNHLLFAPLSNPGKETEGRALIWRPSQQLEIDYIFAWFEKLGIRQIGLAYQEERVNRNLLEYVKQNLQKRGLTLVGVAHVQKNQADTEREAQALAAKRPGLVISLSDSIGTGLFLRAFRKHAERTFVAGTSLINLPTLSEIAGIQSTEWTVFSQVVPNPGGTSTPLQTEHLAMMKRFRDEEVSSMTLEGYAVAKSLTKAITLARGGNLQTILSHKNIDLGGFSIAPVQQNGMSNFVDIALLRRGRSLMF